MTASSSRTFARALSSLFFGALTALMAPQAHDLGIAVAVVGFGAGAASWLIPAQRWKGRPGEVPRPHPVAAALGAALALAVGSAAGALGVPDVPFVIAAAAGGLITGLAFAVTVSRWMPG